jgi:hypothetical protein
MLAKVAMCVRYATRYIPRYGGRSKKVAATVADCSGSQNEGIASADTGCSGVAGYSR